ncbi:A24 family peptidase C-terminal domain-containing protein [uncultured Methanofollis sp.]|uniref:A24 family peptidase C-terminal domain-containing protein n=1 Tax=uncultured Methanofollis sp. TaxID=262500 RepID=UPI0026195F2A|nr:A24 family peptidase C-terminal domain-containing protein [uncultured Methanofollis sp.]
MILPLVIASLAVGATLFYASVLDHRERRVPFRTWYPMLVVAGPCAAIFYAGLVTGGLAGTALYFFALSLVFAAVFYTFGMLHLFGGADAWALIFLCLCIPAFPVEPILGVPPMGFFPFSVITDALLLNLVAPLALCVYNIVRGNRAPFPYMFFGYPVEGAEIRKHFGFVMEEITEEEDGTVTRRFLKLRESLKRTVRGGERRMYTKDLREHPERYARELALYRKAGKVWISYAVPFIIPITAGFVTALFIGDLLFMIIRVLAGV